MKCPTTNTSTINGQPACTGMWNIWEYDTTGTALNLSGGSLTAAAIDLSGNSSRFHWTAGTLTLTSGDVKVVDAQVPTTLGQCLNDGWKQFGFANQGLCLAFVNRS